MRTGRADAQTRTEDWPSGTEEWQKIHTPSLSWIPETLNVRLLIWLYG